MPRPIIPHHPDSAEAKNMSCGCGGKGGGNCGSKKNTEDATKTTAQINEKPAQNQQSQT